MGGWDQHLENLGGGYVLTVVASKDANMGWVRNAMKARVSAIQGILGEL